MIIILFLNFHEFENKIVEQLKLNLDRISLADFEIAIEMNSKCFLRIPRN